MLTLATDLFLRELERSIVHILVSWVKYGAKYARFGHSEGGCSVSAEYPPALAALATT